MSMPEQDEAAQPQGLVEQLKAPLITSTSVPDEADELKQLVEQLTTAAKACDYSPGAKGYIARTNVAGIAKDIARLMMAPSDMSMHHSINMQEIVSIRTLMSLGVLEKIPVNGSISLAELQKVTGVQESFLERHLRMVVGTKFLEMNANYDYVHTKFSKAYAEVPGPGHFFQFMHDENLTSMVNLHSYVKERAKEDNKPIQEPDDPLNCPYSRKHGMDGHSIWEIMAQYPDRIRTFQLAFMSQEESVPIIGFYDFGALYSPKTDGDRPTLVDVGGGQGQSIIQILKAFPSLKPERMVLQDLPEPIAQGKESKALPDAVTAMVHDFWTPQPVKDAKAYFLRRIIHDYSDANCVKILTHLAAVMTPDSKVLIADMVMPKRVYEADLPAAAMDNCLMVMGGKERTAKGLQEILEGAGLKMVKIWQSREGGATGNIVEAMLP